MASFTKLESGKWRALIRIKGHPAVSITRRTKGAAERAAREVEDAIRDGTYQQTAPAAAVLLSDHLAWYLANVTPNKKPSALAKEASRVRILSEHRILKPCTLASLTPETVTRYIADRQAHGIANATITRELGMLAHAIDAATGLRGIPISSNPVTQAKRTLRYTRALAVDDARDRRLSADEEVALLADLNPIMRLAVVLFIETGMRREELCNAKRAHISGHTLRIPTAKTGARTIPLSERAMTAIAELPTRLDGLLLGMRPDSVTQAFARSCKRLGIEGLRIHDLRHEAISRLAERGWSLAEIAAVSGHEDYESLKRYVQIRPEHLAEKLRGNR